MALTTEELIARLDEAITQLTVGGKLLVAPTVARKQQFVAASKQLEVIKAELKARKTCAES